MGKKEIECIFFEYVLHSKAYRFLVAEPNDVVSINTIIESRDAVFYKNKFDRIPKLKSSKDLEANKDLDTLPLMFGEDNEPIQVLNENNEHVEHIELRRSKRVRKKKMFESDFIVYLVEGTRKLYVIIVHFHYI